MILVGRIADDMSDGDDDDDEAVVVGRTVVGRAVVGVGLSRHFRTPTSSSGQSSSGKIVLKNLFTVDSLLTPLSPNSDQHQFSPNNISRSLRVLVMRIT